MTTTPPEMLLTDDDMAKSLAAAIDLPTVYEAAAFRKGFMAAQRALLAKLREQQPVCDLAAGWIAGRAETYAEVYSSNTLAEAYQAGAEFALRSKVLHAAAPVPTPAAQAAQAVPAPQPISTAPKGSRHILAHGDGSGFTECWFVASWGGEMRGWVESFTGRRAEPTHWMPLPAAPTPTGAGDSEGGAR